MKKLLKVLGITIALITVGAVTRALVRNENSQSEHKLNQNLKSMNKLLENSRISR